MPREAVAQTEATDHLTVYDHLLDSARKCGVENRFKSKTAGKEAHVVSLFQRNSQTARSSKRPFGTEAFVTNVVQGLMGF